MDKTLKQGRRGEHAFLFTTETPTTFNECLTYLQWHTCSWVTIGSTAYIDLYMYVEFLYSTFFPEIFAALKNINRRNELTTYIYFFILIHNLRGSFAETLIHVEKTHVHRYWGGSREQTRKHSQMRSCTHTHRHTHMYTHTHII